MKKSNLESLRATADAAVTYWRALRAEAEKAEETSRAFQKAHPLKAGTYGPGGVIEIVSDDLVGDLELQLKVHEARGRAAAAEKAACEALDQLELAEGQPDALARDLTTLRADFVELDAEIQRAKEAVKAAWQRANDRAARAVAGIASTAARRQAAGLPFAHAGFNPMPHKAHLASVDEAITRGVRFPDYAANAESTRAEIRRCAVLLEERRIKKAEEEKEREWRRQQAEREGRESNERMRAQAEAHRVAQEEERKRQAKLADDYLSRRSAGAAQ